ncbi:MAG: PKD domain-containing protein [Thermoprotei archaeon]
MWEPRQRHAKRAQVTDLTPEGRGATRVLALLIVVALLASPHFMTALLGGVAEANPLTPLLISRGKPQQATTPGLPSEPAGPTSPTNQSYPPPEYDEQVGETFTQNFTYINWDVTATAQTGSHGYGPAYLINGLSNTGYWYQVGLAYNWPYESGGYRSGFAMIYEVFSPGGTSIFPPAKGGGWVALSGPVYSNDLVRLSLYFWPQRSSVVMSAYDENTGATATEVYSAEGSEFVGLKGVPSENGFFTGIMTEEYHVDPYYGPEREVIYSQRGEKFSSAWLWAEERDDATGHTLFSNSTASPVNLSDWLYPFWGGGCLEYANSSSLITGRPRSPFPLGLISFSAENVTTDAGVPTSASFTASISGGVPPYYYIVYLDGHQYAAGNAYAESFSSGFLINDSAGTHLFYVVVEDSANQTVKGPTYEVVINPDPRIALKGKTAYDAGQYLNVTPSITGGTPPYSISYFVNGSPLASPYCLSRVGAADLYASVLDSEGQTARSEPLILEVYPDPQVTASYSANATDVNLPISFNVSVSGGDPPYSYAWLVNQTARSARGPYFTLTPTNPGDYEVTTLVTDSAGYEVKGAVIVEAFLDPTLTGASISSSSSNPIYSATEATLSVNVSGGVQPMTYRWYLNGELVAVTGSPSHAYQLSLGRNSIAVEVTDKAGYSVSSETFAVDSYYNYELLLIPLALIAILMLAQKAKRREKRA